MATFVQFLSALCLAVLVSVNAQTNPGQLVNSKWQEVNIRLCVAGFKQFHLCERLRSEMRLDATLTQGTVTFYINLPGASQSKFAGSLTCIAANHSYECAELVAQNKADVARFKAEELYGLSKITQFANLAVINGGKTQLQCPPSSECHEFSREYSVAVVSKASGIKQLADLRDRKACFGEVGTTAGWTIPIFKLRSNWTQNNPFRPPIITRKRRQGGRIYANVTNTNSGYGNGGAAGAGNVQRCPLDLNIANDVFPSSCAPGVWATQNSFATLYSQRLCADCMGRNQSCTMKEPSNMAMECLRNGKGEIAFVSSLEVDDYFTGNTEAQDYALLCRVGLRNIFEYHYCHWGVIPSDGYIVYNGQGRQHPSQVYGEFIHQLYSKARTDYYPEEVIRDLLAGVGEQVVSMERLDMHYGQNQEPVAVPNPQTYLQREGGEEFYATMQGSFPTCANRDKMRMCVLSNSELQKCYQMQMAFRGASMPQTLECLLGYSELDCVSKINSSLADVAMISAHRADHAMHEQKIKPLLGESYGNSEPVYAIAVALSSGRAQKMKDLDSGQLNVCSAGTDSFAGWEAPNRAFKNLKMIQSTNCKLTEAWARMFRGGCVPGAKNASVTLGRNSTTPIDINSASHLCSMCAAGSGKCLTPPEAKGNPNNYDMYYGDIGALRCLVRRKGDVAFLRSTALQTMLTLKEMGDNDFRTLIPSSNFVVLCPDGTTKKAFSANAIANCNLGRMPDRWMVARANADAEQLLRWQDLWLIASNRARMSYDWLRTYVRKTDHILDLIFTNTTTKFQRFPVVSVPEHYFDEFAYEHWNSPFVCSGASGKLGLCSLVIALSTYILHRVWST